MVWSGSPARILVLGAAFVTALTCALPSHGATRLHALIIGNNHPLRVTPGPTSSSLATLRYADDDGAAFYDLIEPMAHGLELLTVMDRETQAIYPELAARALPPTLDEVRAAVARLGARMALERQQGHRNEVLVFFSGHGALDAGGEPALALFDGGLTQEFLYREVLERLPADAVHLLIDACHAEAVVRPRDAEGDVVEVSADQARAFLTHSTLARFPHAGAIVAASSNTKAHEWDSIRHGVFTYELLSALRGAADINRDRLIEYSEVYAFMAAANREISDDRARLSVVAKPPDNNRRTPILRLSEFPRNELAWIAGVPGVHGIIEVSDARGRRLATLHGDRDSEADLLLPIGSVLYVRAGSGEARLQLRAGQVIPFERLDFVTVSGRERGALEDSLREGLFAAAYGRSYYQGIVDQSPGLIPVPFSGIDVGSYWQELPATSKPAIVVGGGLSMGIADVVPLSHGLSIGVRPQRNNGLALSLDFFGAEDGPLTERHLHARAGWLWTLTYGPMRGSAGALIGAGVFSQQVEGGPTRYASSRYSPAASAGPMLGLSAQLSERVATWSELQLFGVLHQHDGDVRASLMPCAWLGAALSL
jgi:hypothetical protein